jgi:photosystem II stability/assembly factor-like uncharacterized protein
MTQRRSLLILAAFSALAGVGQSQDWKQVGPAPIEHSNGGGTNVTASGLVNDIAIDPTGGTDRTIYIATGAGGIWKTTDGGGSWSALTDLMPDAQTMGAVALDPSANPAIVYAGVGGNWCCLGGGGIYRSRNGKGDWKVLNPNGIFTGVPIDRIVLPSPGTLLVSTTQGLYKSIDGGDSFGTSPTFNNGRPIPITTPNGIISNGNISDLKLDTATPTTVYAAIGGVGLFKSVDSGSTFPASGILFGQSSFPPAVTVTGNVWIKFAQSTRPNNQTMYAFLCNGTVQLGARKLLEPCAILKSINGGGAFSRISLNPGINVNQGDYDQIAGVDPQDANKVYIGLRRLFFSGDGGRSFSQSSNYISPNPSHVDFHAIAFSTAPATKLYTRVFVGNDGGFSSTAAQGSTPGSQWQYLNNGLATVLFFGMDMGRGSIANNAYIYGAAQDNGFAIRTLSGSGASSWNPNQSCCGDDLGVAVDPTNPTRAFGINGPICGPFVSLGWPGPVFPGNLCLVSFDPNGGGIAYASAGPQLYLGKSNAAVSSLMHTFPQNVTAMNQVKGDPNTMWVGLFNGTVQYTHNALQGAQSTWTARTVNGAPGNQAVSGIAIDPINRKTVVVVYPGLSGCVDSMSGSVPCSSKSAGPPKHVFITTNDGTCREPVPAPPVRCSGWSNISGTTNGGDNNLPDLPLNAVVIVPSTSPHTVVVGSAAGVMQSADAGRTWQVLGTGFPTVSVKALAFDQVNPLVLRAATFGRSVFELEGSCPLCPPPPQCSASTDCSGVMSVSCTGQDVGVIFNGNCFGPSGEPTSCVAGFHGLSTVSAGGTVDWLGSTTSPNRAQACTKNATGQVTCIIVTAPVADTTPCQGNFGPPPGDPCFSGLGSNELWCARLGHCVNPSQYGALCGVTPAHP